jgi:hypothetical protein
MSTQRLVRSLVTGIVVLALGGPLGAGTIRLRWDPVAGAAGYRVYVGTTSQSYTDVIQVFGATEAEIPGLADCRSHYLAVKAFNAAGESIDFSNEIEGWPRPEVTPRAPFAVMQGAQLTLDVPGNNFQPGADVVLMASGIPTDTEGTPLVRIDSVAVLSCSQIQALVTVEPTARGFRAMEVGTFPITFEVYNPDSVYGSGPVALDVQFDPARLDINRADADTRDRVDGKDLVWLAFAHGAAEGQPRYSADADLNGDGLVDGVDLAYLASGFGACWTGSAWSTGGCR